MTGLSFFFLLLVSMTVADKPQQLPVLRTFKDFVNEVDFDSDGVYRFKYHVGDSEREESRTASGEVNGNYAFVAPEGDEYEFKYAADLEGYRVESDALPVHPEDTDDVKAAKEAFFKAYQEALERAEEESDEDEESDESDESDEFEESSEEYSSEEDSDEDDDDDEEESNFIQSSHFGIPYPYTRK